MNESKKEAPIPPPLLRPVTLDGFYGYSKVKGCSSEPHPMYLRVSGHGGDPRMGERLEGTPEMKTSICLNVGVRLREGDRALTDLQENAIWLSCDQARSLAAWLKENADRLDACEDFVRK